MLQIIGAFDKPVEGPLSCWRKVFVANELCELSNVRRTQPALTFILLVRMSLAVNFTFGQVLVYAAVSKAADFTSSWLVLPSHV